MVSPRIFLSTETKLYRHYPIDTDFRIFCFCIFPAFRIFFRYIFPYIRIFYNRKTQKGQTDIAVCP